MSGLDALPIPHREIARTALTAAFGSAQTDSVTKVPGGATQAALYRVDRDGRAYVLRIEGTPSPLRNPHQYESLRIAAEAGIAPPVYYTDAARGVLVTDFIAERPLGTYPGGPRALAAAVGTLLAELQDTPVFPAFMDYPDIVGRLFAHVGRTGLFAPGLLDAHTAALTRIHERWKPAQLVSSHNDPNPRNILFDGTRFWLIDWESAYCNDALIDVAIALDNLAPSLELEDVLLSAWHGDTPAEAIRARLATARALTRLYYAGVLLSASATIPRAAPDADLATPTLDEFRCSVRNGALTPGTAEIVHVVGKMYLAAFLSGDPVPALAEVALAASES
jgi:aminoglycoside phosphotransferase (APT) family kinase protein